MIPSLLIRGLIQRLHDAGYDSISTPFRVASVDFEFTAALRGRKGRALDLILLIDTSTGDFGDREPLTVRRRVEALSRALDITQSRYLLTVILAGATLAGDIEALTQTCRVLIVETAALDDEGRPTDPAAAETLDDQIRLLLPLTLPFGADHQQTEVDAIASLGAALPKTVDPDLSRAVIAASTRGEKAVTKALSEVLSRALIVAEEE